MGHSSYSTAAYAARVNTARSTGTDYFSHTADIDSGRQAAHVHEKLDPAGLNRLGRNVRESRDSAEHPTSRAVVVVFDVTGSMARVPRLFVERLGGLMQLLRQKQYIADPQVMMAAVGDATCDKVPLQFGQYESGNEMDEALSLIHLEGGGGSLNTESYELAMYYLARHTELDCVEKRGQKAYLFLIGDEVPYPRVKKREVEKVIGDVLQEDIPLTVILTELRAKYNVYWILPGQTSNWSDQEVGDRLTELFGQHLIRLSNPRDICETIAATIGLGEGVDITAVRTDLTSAADADVAAVGRATDALAGLIRPRLINVADLPPA